jgi:hypothetical protein
MSPQSESALPVDLAVSRVHFASYESVTYVCGCVALFTSCIQNHASHDLFSALFTTPTSEQVLHAVGLCKLLSTLHFVLAYP